MFEKRTLKRRWCLCPDKNVLKWAAYFIHFYRNSLKNFIQVLVRKRQMVNILVIPGFTAGIMTRRFIPLLFAHLFMP